MRLLHNSPKTAILFYAILAVIILLINCLIPGYFPLLPFHSQPTVFQKRVRVLDMVPEHQQLNDRWDQVLKKSGNNPRLFSQFIKSSVVQRTYHRLTAKWVHSEIQIVLPAIVGSVPAQRSLEKFARLRGEISQSLGLVKRMERWGYCRMGLWVQMDWVQYLPMQDRRFIIQVQRVTLIQPVRYHQKSSINVGGLLPQFNPQIPITKFGLENPQFIEIPSNQITRRKLFGPRVAIIIDDVGFEKEPADEILKIPAQLTWAILPFGPYSREYLQNAKRHHLEVILHLPLEPINNLQNPGPGLIRKKWTPRRMVQQLEADLKEVPGVVGINNHMGSAGTQNDQLMGVIMQEIKQRGMYFVDSMTIDKSVASKYAELFQVPFGERKVFIDNDNDQESQEVELRNLIKQALKDGSAIGITHARPGRAKAIMEMLPEFRKAGVQIVPASEIVSVANHSLK